jgi:hypothetical protein
MMSLDNLVRTGQLKTHTTNASEIQRLLAAATRNLEDASVTEISDETRFDAGYKSIMQCALLGLMASGDRPATSAPGHHQTMIQTLPLTFGLANEEWLVLDALRKKRNINDYSGDLIDPESLRECLVRAKDLIDTAQAWLRQQHPAFLD